MRGYKTYIGIAVAVLALAAKALGVDVPAESELPTWLVEGIGLLGTALAAFGRLDKERRAPDPS